MTSIGPATGAPSDWIAPSLNVFMDESGTNELDSSKSNVSHLFVCAAVVVADEQRGAAEAAMRDISRDLCSGAEVKSSRIGPNHKRRQRFLERIQDIDFSYSAIVVNKSRIDDTSGLRFKKSFYKFFSANLQARLTRLGASLRVYADRIGSEEFMGGFTSYLETQFARTLFCTYGQEFVASVEQPLVQLSDLVAGSLSYCFDEGKRCPMSSVFRELLRTKETEISAWPLVEPAIVPAGPATDAAGWEKRLQALCRNRAHHFVATHQSDPAENRMMQVATLETLLFARLYEEGSNQSVYTDSLIELLRAKGFDMASKRAFRSNVIGRLRDDGIVIVGTNEGCRLAMSSGDIADYLAQAQGMLAPMLSRVATARRSVRQDTNNGYDILDSEAFSVLRGVVDKFGDVRMDLAVASEGSCADSGDADEEIS